MIHVMGADLAYIQTLIDIDSSVLQILVTDYRVLDTLCESPLYNQKVLLFITEKYKDSLSKDDLSLIQSALADIGNHLSSYNGEEEERAVIDMHPQLMEKSATATQYFAANPILTPLHIQRMTEGVDLNKGLMEYVNTQLEVETPVLDAFLFQTYWEKLASKGIALLSTIRSTEAIEMALLEKIRKGSPLSYMTNISIENDDLIPMVSDDICFRQPMRYAVWPVWISNRHYGLLFLDLAPSLNPSSPRGVYIEPLSLQSILMGIDNPPNASDNADMIGIACNQIFSQQARPMISGLGIEGQPFSVLFLSQTFDEHYCSDYVIAVLARVASEELNLTKDLTPLSQLMQEHLSEDVVQIIRMLEIKMFGIGYFKLQLRKGLTDEDIVTATARFLQPSQVAGHSHEEQPMACRASCDWPTLDTIGLFARESATPTKSQKKSLLQCVLVKAAAKTLQPPSHTNKLKCHEEEDENLKFKFAKKPM